MSNDHMSSSEGGDVFLDYMLRSALTAPGASTSPTAGRILARLLVVIAIEGGADVISPYLVPEPGETATFEVRGYRPGNLNPTEVRADLDSVAALRTAIRLAREGDAGIEVISQSPSGLERCVLVRDSTGEFEFRFAGGETLTGDSDACLAARRAWSATLDGWRSWVLGTPPQLEPTGAQRVVEPSETRRALPGGSAPPESEPEPESGSEPTAPEGVPAVAAAAVDAPAEPPAAPTAAPERPRPAEQVSGKRPLFRPWGRVAPASPAPIGPGVAAPWATIRDRPPAPAHEEDPSDAWRDQSRDGPETPEVEEAPDTPDAPDTHDASVAPEPPPPPPPAPDNDALLAAIHDGFANLTVEVDLSAVEQAIRRAVDADRRNLVEPLARRVAIAVRESIDVPDTGAVVDSVVPLLPRPGDIAEVVSARIADLLSETVLRRGQSETTGSPAVSGMMAAVERFEVQMDGLHDQLRRATGVLETFGDRLQATDRRAAAVERTNATLEVEMKRLVRRVDEQVAALVANATGGSELSDGVARLTRKLRQSVAQLDRALVRLDLVLDDEGAPPALSEGGHPDDEMDPAGYDVPR